LISESASSWPSWSADSRELVFFALDEFSLTSVSIVPNATFEYGEPASLFGLDGLERGSAVSLSPDGDRVLMLKRAGREEAEDQRLILVQGFDRLLQERVGGGR
jgi:hypothetical protein